MSVYVRNIIMSVG